MYVIRGSIDGWKITDNSGNGEIERIFESEKEVFNYLKLLEDRLPFDATAYILNEDGTLGLLL